MADEITGRDDYLIAQALYIAIRVMRQAEFPQESNIKEMEVLLRSRFPGFRETLDLQHYLGLARARGWQKSGAVTVDDLKRWLAENTDSGQVLPFRPIT